MTSIADTLAKRNSVYDNDYFNDPGPDRRLRLTQNWVDEPEFKSRTDFIAAKKVKLLASEAKFADIKWKQNHERVAERTIAEQEISKL